MVRASSPPEAARARGCRASPALAPSRKVTWSAGPRPFDGDREAGRSHGQPVQGRLDLCGQAGSGLAAGRGHRRLGLLEGGPGLPISSSTTRPGVRRRRCPPRRWRAVAAKATTSARSSPYLRWSSWSSCRRDRMAAEPLGVVIPGLHHRTQLGGQVGELGHDRPDPARRAPTGGLVHRGRPPLRPAGPRRWPLPPPTAQVRATAAASRWAADVGQPFLLRLQTSVLVDVLDGGLLDFGDLEVEEVDLAGPLAGVAAQCGPLVGEPAQTGGEPCRAGGRYRRNRRGPVVGLRRGPASGAGADRAARPVPAAISARAPTEAIRPSIQARERPPRTTARASTTSVSRPPSRRSDPSAAASAAAGQEEPPSTRASSAPARTTDGSARPPSSSPSASTSRVLPAPVSPVSAVMPGRNGDGHVVDDPEVADPELDQGGAQRSSVLPVGQMELGPQDGVEVPGAEGDQQGRSVALAALDGATPDRGVVTVTPSTTSTAGRGSSTSSRIRSVGSRTSGPVEDHVRRDRGDHDGPQEGGEHRAAGRQVVGRRPGRGGHQQTVGRVGHEGSAVDGGGDPHGVAGDGLLDRGLVEGAAVGPASRRRGRSR